MRRILLVVAVVSSLVIASTASAAQNYSQASGARKGPIAKLIELEKRKNEYLRQRFLGK